MMLVTDEGIYRGRRVKEKLEKRCLEYGFKVPPKEKGVVEWKRLQSMFGMFAGTRDWKMWVFREGRGIRRTRYQNLCEYYSVGAPSRFTIGRTSEGPRPSGTFRYRSVSPGAGSIAGSVGPTTTPPEAAPQQWSWGNTVAASPIRNPTLEPTPWPAYAQQLRVAQAEAQIRESQQQAASAPSVDPTTPGNWDEFIAQRYASMVERQRARNLPDPEFPINEF